MYSGKSEHTSRADCSVIIIIIIRTLHDRHVTGISFLRRRLLATSKYSLWFSSLGEVKISYVLLMPSVDLIVGVIHAECRGTNRLISRHLQTSAILLFMAKSILLFRALMITLIRLQSDVNRLLQWSRTWLLRFNIAKCKLMRIGNSAPFTYSVLDSSTNLPFVITEVQ